MQTDRQDLDKRYINLLCVEPHIAFPPCDGSLKLTEYGYDVNYESETDCADLNKTCTIIDKFISKRPEAGDVGGKPDIPPPIPTQTGVSPNSVYSFAKGDELGDGRLLLVHYGNTSSFKQGYLKVSLFEVGVSGDPVHITTVNVEAPTGGDLYCNGDIDIITFGSDTFLIVYFTLGETTIMRCSISGVIITFDSYLVKAADERCYSANFSKFDSESGFALFMNKVLTTDTSMSVLAYTYSAGVFTQLLSEQSLEAGYPASMTVPGPPAYDPPDACGGEIVYNEVNQAYDFAMDIIKETADYYQFIGGHKQIAVINYVQMLNAFSWCLPIPQPIYKTIFVPTAIKIYKATGTMQYWHTLTYYRITYVGIGGLYVKRLGTTERVVGIFPVPAGDEHYIMGLYLSGNYAFLRRNFKLQSSSGYTDGALYDIDNESCAVAITGEDNKTEVYPIIWLEDDTFFGYIDGSSKLVVGAINSMHLRGRTLVNGRICLFIAYSGYKGYVYVLDISYV